MAGHEFGLFGRTHLIYLFSVAAVWVAVLGWGRSRLDPRHYRRAAMVLIALSLGQELFDDVTRALHGAWTLEEHAPLHLCSFALFAGVYALYTRRQFAFEVAYFWAFAACTQALLTPDNSRWGFTLLQGRLDFDALWNFVSHGLIVLNVLWLIVVEQMRCRRGSWLKVFGFTNLAAALVALVNRLIGEGANYFFLCRKPGGESPFLMGEWPYYILWFEVLALAFFGLLYLPMRRSQHAQ